MQKKIPMRMCIGCREMKPKRELVRVAANSAGEVAVDPTGKAPGRGAYLCKNNECLKRALKSRALERALEKKIAQEVFTALEKSIAEFEAATGVNDN